MLFSDFVLLFFGYVFLVILVILSYNFAQLSSVPIELSPLATFLIREYIMKYDNYLETSRFASISIDGQHRFVYASRYGVSCVTAVGAWTKRWAR